MNGYDLIYSAVADRRRMSGTYNGFYREFCPHVLGTKESVSHVLVFQFGGQSSKGPLPPGGEWRCFELHNMRDLQITEGAWVTAVTKGIRPQSCVSLIDIEVSR